jgi:hypothetical protein
VSDADLNTPGTMTPTIDELVIADDPKHWISLGFEVAQGCCQLASVRLRFVDHSAGPGILSWSLRGLSGSDLDGLTTTCSERPIPPVSGAHRNGVIAIDHVVVMSPVLDRSVLAFQSAGLDLRRIREQPTPAGAPRQAFFRLGSEILEMIQEPDEVLKRDGGTERPAQFWGLALRVDDLERTVEHLAPHASPIRPAVQPGRQIATLRRSAGVAIPIALMTGP